MAVAGQRRVVSGDEHFAQGLESGAVRDRRARSLRGAEARRTQFEAHQLGEARDQSPVFSLHKLPQVNFPMVAAAVLHLTADVIVRLLYGCHSVRFEMEHK